MVFTFWANSLATNGNSAITFSGYPQPDCLRVLNCGMTPTNQTVGLYISFL